jgi:hypothetical protein
MPKSVSDVIFSRRGDLPDSFSGHTRMAGVSLGKGTGVADSNAMSGFMRSRAGCGILLVMKDTPGT